MNSLFCIDHHYSFFFFVFQELSSKYNAMFEDICAAIDPRSNYKNIRSSVRTAGESFCLPYLGI
jgi:hypothetical protein